MVGKLPYDHNPHKYDQLIDKALEEEVDVYGLTTPAGPTDSVGHWAEYIRDGEGDSNLILVGKSHVDRWEGSEVRRVSPEQERRHPPLYFTSEINLPANLVSLGVSPEEIVTVSTHYQEEEATTRLCQRDQSPEGFARSREYQNVDYLLLTGSVTS